MSLGKGIRLVEVVNYFGHSSDDFKSSDELIKSLSSSSSGFSSYNRFPNIGLFKPAITALNNAFYFFSFNKISNIY